MSRRLIPQVGARSRRRVGTGMIASVKLQCGTKDKDSLRTCMKWSRSSARCGIGTLAILLSASDAIVAHIRSYIHVCFLEELQDH